MLESNTKKLGPNGITENVNRMVIIRIPGAIINTGLSENEGTQSSLKNNFIVSAMTWKSPNGPTLLGPNLSCQTDKSLRSTHIRPAAMESGIKRTPKMIKIYSIYLLIIYCQNM